VETEGRSRLSLSTKVLLGLAAGVLCGVFFGETVGFLRIAGDAFVQLLQMTVLPYVVLSLITSLGQLTYAKAASLAKKCGALLLLLWTMGLALVLAFPFAFPEWESASFFSTSLTREAPEFDFLQLYIPANLFFSLANSIVPAVVVFSIAVGAALIGVGNKQGLIEGLSALLGALSRVTGFVVSLAPVGVFAIAASAAGTMGVAELKNLQVFVIIYVGIALLMALWVLPGLVSVLTPLRYRDVLGVSRDALVTAFATGNVFVVLPILAEKGKELLRREGVVEQGAESAVDVIVPTSYSFPTLGTVFSLSFILFAAWISGVPVSAAQYPTFAFTGLFSMFGGAFIAIPFMLDLLRIPSDTFELFVVVSNVVVIRFEALLSAMHMLVLALLGACAMSGRLRIKWSRLLRYVVLTVAAITLTMIGIRLFLTYGLEREYMEYRIFMEMDLSREPAPAQIHTDSLPAPIRLHPQESRLERILERGSLRVGYLEDSLPFAFKNAAGRLVGFDIEMAHQLAKEMGVSVEFVRITRGGQDIAKLINEGIVDTMMSGIVITTKRVRELSFSVPYMDGTLAFVVEDHRRSEFTNWEDVRSMENLVVGVLNDPYYISKARDSLPGARIEVVDSPREFFRKNPKELDALLYSAEAGSAWSLVYPDRSVAVAHPRITAVPMGYPLPRGETDMIEFVNTWIDLKRKDGTIESLYDYWILGKEAEKKQPRWSVIRNVLHWTD
jgi:Na+/H+-dicarboxylate symporter/ABC-type amino acid transport substrate-binding protein